MNPEEQIMPQDGELLPAEDDGSKAEFGAHLEELDKRNNDLSSKMESEKEKIKQEKIKMLQEFYAKLSSLGVDPNDVDSISAYLQKLEQESPDSVIIIQMILDILDPEKDLGAEEPAEGELPPSVLNAPIAPAMPAPEMSAPQPTAPTEEMPPVEEAMPEVPVPPQL